MVDGQTSTAVAPDPDKSGERALPLVVSRTFVPPLPANHVPRTRLWDAVNRGVSGGTTTINGAPGSGKTVLAASWVAAGRAPGPVAWLTVDGDATADLWAHLLQALERSGALPAGVAPARVPPPTLDGGPVRFWRNLANVLAELPTPVVLVIDDVHLITDPIAVAGLELLATCGGPAVRLVLSARYPVLALHRLRLDGRLVEIGPDDLAFTAGETSELFEAHGVDLPVDGRDRLLERTEGWAAGLRLSAAQTSPDGRSVHHDLAARGVAEYLREEVLGQQPSVVRRLLLRASVLDRLTGSLLDTVAAEPGGMAAAVAPAAGSTDGDQSAPAPVVDGRTLLADLARTNSFVIGVDDGETWYRFHRLLADALHADLVQEAREDEPELHLRAALWFAEHRDVSAAVRHACQAGDWRYAACLLIEGGLGVITGSGDLECDGRVGALVDAFPPAAADQSTECALVVAAGRVRAGEADAAGRHLDAARARVSDLSVNRRRPVTTALDVVEARRAELQADPEEMLNCARKLLRSGNHPADTGWQAAAGQRTTGQRTTGPADGLPAVRAHALAIRGRAELWRGRLDSASEALRAALRPAREVGARECELSCLGGLAVLHAWRGRLRLAMAWAGEALDADRRWSAAMVRDQHRPMAAATGLADAHLAMALVAYQNDDLAEAHRHSREAGRYCGLWPQPVTAELLVLFNAILLACEGDVRTARRLVGAHQPGRMPDICVRARLAVEGELLVAAGNPDAALAVLRRGITEHRPDPAEVLALARVHLARADPPAAVAMLAPLLRADTGFGIGSITAACVLDAVAAGRGGDVARATASLARALALAEEEGVVRPFVDAGEEVTALLRAHPGLRAAHPELVGRLLGRAAVVRPRSAQAAVAIAACGPRPVEPSLAAPSLAAPAGTGVRRPTPAVDGHAHTTSVTTPSQPLAGTVGNPPLEAIVSGQPGASPELLAVAVEPLSGREQAVLSYLPTMLTTAEIAKEMFVSVNTVKTHLKSIYRKLGVARRRDAVQRARALHLL